MTMPFGEPCIAGTVLLDGCGGVGIGIGAVAACGDSVRMGIDMAGEWAGAERRGSAMLCAACPRVVGERFAAAFFFAGAFFAVGFDDFGIVIPGMFICAEAGTDKNAATANAAALATKDRGFTNSSGSGHGRSATRHPQRHRDHHQIFVQWPLISDMV